jgi:replicative DNA helicase
MHPDVERHVLGAMLIDINNAGPALERLKPEEFGWQLHADLFTAARELYSAQGLVDPYTLIERAAAMRPEADKERIASEVWSFSAEVVSAANIGAHVALVKEAGLRRRMIVDVGNLLHLARNPDRKNSEVMGAAESLILSLAEEQVAQGLVPFKSIIPETLADLARSASGKLTGVNTGLAELNRITMGLQPTDLIILAGRPAMGKTAMGLSVSINAALAGEPVAFFSMEMGRKQLQQRAICKHKNLDLHKLRTGRLTAEEMEIFRQSVGELADIPLYIDDQNGKTPLQILSQSKRLKAQKGLKLIVVDFCQLGRLDEKVDSRALEVGKFAYGLKGIAKELDIPVLGLAQLNREVEKRNGDSEGNIDYKMSDLNESGGLEQAADIVAMVHRFEVLSKTAERGKAKLQLVKHRNGPTGEIDVRFNAESASFSDYVPDAWIEQGDTHASKSRAPGRAGGPPPERHRGDPGPSYEPYRPARVGEAGFDL